MLFTNSFYIASHEAAISFLIWTSSLFFFFRHFYLSTRSISVFHWLSCFRVFSGLFPVPFWKTWILVTVYKLCHVPHASRITTCGTIFTERHFSVSKEWVRSWSHDFLITYHKTLTKKLFGGTSRKSDEKETKKKMKEWRKRG